MEALELVFEPINDSNKKAKCGCYVINNPDLLNKHANQFIIVPLKSSKYHLQIVNSIANVTLTQHYQNPTEKFLEVEYSFPINPNACIYRFVAEFGTTRIEGIVKEKEEAKLQYQQAIKEGKKAAYGEINAESKDIINLKVGNVSPKESVKIEISYLQELTLTSNMFYQLHMVGTISPRYLNYIPGERIAAGLRDEGAKAQGKFYWNFSISLKTTRKTVFFDSHSHDIQLLSQNDCKTESMFAMSKSSVPNKDFYFTYTTEDYQLPSYVFGRTDVGSTAMLSFIPKFCTLNIDDAYKASVLGKGYETDIENAKGQYVFLLDRSGSMGGTRIEKAKQALILFIKSLPQDTYFNVISFGSGSASMFPKSVKYNDKEVTAAIKNVEKMSADMGGTEIYGPLNNLISGPPIEGYPKQIFLLTDGGVSNTEGVIKMVGLKNKYSRVHTIGIGNGCSQELILGCAKKGKGYHVFISDGENPSEKIIQLLTDSLSPVISRMKLSYDPNLVESIIPNPESLPYILKGELVNFYITFKGQLQKKVLFTFSYEDSINKMPYQSEMLIDPNTASDSFIDRMGHFKRIRLLEESHSTDANIEELMYYVKIVDKEAKKKQIINESVKHQILSEFTAFICVESELKDGKYQEIKETGKLKVQIENPPPIEYQEELELKSARIENVKLCMQNNVLKMQNIGCMIDRSQKLQSLEQRSYDLCSSSKAFTQESKKKSAGVGGLFNSIKNFFTSSSPPKSAPPPSSPSPPSPRSNFSNSAQVQQCCFMPMSDPSYQMSAKLCDLDCDDGIIPQNPASFSSPSSLSFSSPPTITELVSSQSTDGSWKDITVIGRLLGKAIEQKIAKEGNMIVVVTYLISRWIEKYHPEKQYSLVAKKGINFVKKHADNFEKFTQMYDQYIA